MAREAPASLSLRGVVDKLDGTAAAVASLDPLPGSTSSPHADTLLRMLQKGQQLSHYRLIEKIGQGGMGEVWRAADDRLSREVAVKVLPEALTRDPSRLERFEREAKALAALNHPGIATIHDVNEADGVRFLVMELIPGEDLSQVLARGALPVTEALLLALEIARSVEVAHAQGIVHRDLKPANVKRTPDGKIKVLDFGLAKTVEPEATSAGDSDRAHSPTVTSAGTIAGVILGTAAYMSPEQARGRLIDKRTDIWSFGVLLYELLTGTNPFHGDTVADSVGAIMHRDPDLDALPDGTPVGIRRLLRRCLRRERSHRLHDIADARIELEEAIEAPDTEVPAIAETQSNAPSRAPWIALAVLVPLVAAIAWWIGSIEPPEIPEPTRQFKIAHDVEVDEVSVSPDGTLLAYSVGQELFIRSLDSLESRKIADLDSPSSNTLFWASDSRQLGVVDGGLNLKRIDLATGPQLLLTSALDIQYPQWLDDGHIYFVNHRSEGISRIPESGGAPEVYLPAQKGLADYHGLSFMPDGKSVVSVPHLDNGARTMFLEQPGKAPLEIYTSDSYISNPLYSAGHILFERSSVPRGLWALPFSLSEQKATGPPVLVMAELNEATATQVGDLVYRQSAVGSDRQHQQITWVDRRGQAVKSLDLMLNDATAAVLSPDQSKIAVIARGVGRASGTERNLWVVDIERGTGSRLSDEGSAVSAPPIWSADGSRIAYAREFEGADSEVVWIAADGRGSPEKLFEGGIGFNFDLNRDWSTIVFSKGTLSGPTGLGIDTQTVGDPSSRFTFLDSPKQDGAPALHPTQPWVAYISGTFSTADTMIRPFPSGEGQWQASTEQGGFPIWSPDGAHLYYRSVSTTGKRGWYELSFDGSGATPKLGLPVRLFDSDQPVSPPQPVGDGTFMFVKNREAPEGEEKRDPLGIVVIQNWASRFANN